MFIPYFIAILMGLVNPLNKNQRLNCGGSVYVTTTSDANGDPDGERGDDGTGINGPGNGNGTGGDTGHTPPPKP